MPSAASIVKDRMLRTYSSSLTMTVADLDGRVVHQHPLRGPLRHELAPGRHLGAREPELDHAAAGARPTG